MNAKVDAKGDVGVNIGQNYGPITLNMRHGEKKDPEVSRAVSELLTLINQHGIYENIRTISEKLFKTGNFMSLERWKIAKLRAIADVLIVMLNEARAELAKKEEVEEREFFEETKMRASAPARVGLRLFLKENLTTTQLASAWKDGVLTYNDHNQFSIKLRSAQRLFGTFLFALAITFALTAFFTNPLLTTLFPSGHSGLEKVKALTIGFSLGLSICLFWISVELTAPYFAAQRISKYIDKVNTKLREITNKEGL